MHVRKIEQADHDAVTVMMKLIYKQHAALREHHYDEADTKTIQSALEHDELIFVACEQNEIIGFLRAEYTKKNTRVVIHEIFVQKNHRNQGVGEALVQHLLDTPPAGDIVFALRIDVKNAEAMKFWNAQEFETTHYYLEKIRDS